MDTQLTPTELQTAIELLQDYAPAQAALTGLSESDGNLEQCFDRLWEEKYGKQDFGIKGKSLWQSTLSVIRQELCGDEGFQTKVREYSKNPASTPLLTGSIVSVVGAAGLPIDPAIATVVVLYIVKVGINIFCEYIKPA